jgi:hypothetical protein
MAMLSGYALNLDFENTPVRCAFDRYAGERQRHGTLYVYQLLSKSELKDLQIRSFLIEILARGR